MSKSISASYNKVAHEYVARHGYGEHLALPALKYFTKKLAPGFSVLDVGCGGGQDSKFLLDQGFSVWGIDVSREMIKLARQYAPTGKFRVIDLYQMKESSKYDAIWCCRVFHHISLKEQVRFIKKLRRLLSSNGYLYLTSVVSDNKTDYEIFDSGSDGLLKKRLTDSSFKQLLLDGKFQLIRFKYWQGKKGMEIIARKTHGRQKTK